jgi:hypothetical protein
MSSKMFPLTCPIRSRSVLPSLSVNRKVFFLW